MARIRLRRLACLGIILAVSVGCGARSRHVVVVLDQSIYETLNTISVLEQQALCQRDVCVEIDAQGNRHQYMTPICGGPGPDPICWSLDKSQAFNRKMVVAAVAGKEFNRVLSIWEPGMAPPERIHELIVQIAAALTQITLEFPEGTTKTTILANIGRTQAIILQAIDLFFTSISEPTVGAKLSITGK